MKLNSFSIVIPSFNDLRIIETISSINQQNYPRNKIEIIISDGGSDEKIIDEIKSAITENDNLLIEKDEGIFDGINKGLQRSKNEIIFALGSDDRFCSKNALTLVNEIIENGSDYVCSTIKYTDQNWQPIRNWNATKPTLLNFIFGRQVAHFGYFAKKSVYELNGYFDINRTVAADFDYFLRLSKSNFKCGLLEEHIVDMKMGGNSSKNIKNILKGNLDIFKAGFKHLGPLILIHFLFKPFWKVREFLISSS